MQVKKDRAKSRGGKWEYMHKRLKGEENTVAKLEEQPNVHKDPIRERKAKLGTGQDGVGCGGCRPQRRAAARAGERGRPRRGDEQAGRCGGQAGCTDGTSGARTYAHGSRERCGRFRVTGEPKQTGRTVKPGKDAEAIGRTPRPAGEGDTGTEAAARRGCTGRCGDGRKRSVRHAWCGCVMFV